MMTLVLRTKAPDTVDFLVNHISQDPYYSIGGKTTMGVVNSKSESAKNQQVKVVYWIEHRDADKYTLTLHATPPAVKTRGRGNMAGGFGGGMGGFGGFE